MNKFDLDTFRCRLVNEKHDIIRICIPENNPAWMGMLNILCGAKPVEWIGHNSHNKIILCTPELKTAISNICSEAAGTMENLELISKFFNDQPDNSYLAFLREGVLLTVDDNLINEACSMVLRHSYQLIPDDVKGNKKADDLNCNRPFRLFRFTSNGKSDLLKFGKGYPAGRRLELISLLNAVEDFDMKSMAESNHFWKLADLKRLADSEAVKNSRVTVIIKSEINSLKDCDDNTTVVYGVLENINITQLTILKHACCRSDYKSYYQNRMIFDRLLYINGYTHKSYTDLGFQYRIPGYRTVCRFCGKSHREGVEFRKDPHAISYFFGNKYLLGGGECDNCNNYFGRQLEPDFYRYYLPTMIRCGMTGRGKNPYVEGENFYLNLQKVQILGSENDADSYDRLLNGEEVPVEFRDDQPMVKADIYRCLCKYVVSLIDDKELPDFAETIKWINRKKLYGCLPATFRNEKDLDYTETPTVEIYRPMQYDESKYGWIVAFRFVTNLWVFAVPYVKGCSNALMTDITDRFIKNFIPRLKFVKEDFSDEGLSYITTHFTYSMNEHTTYKRFIDMAPEEQQEFHDSMPRKWKQGNRE